MGDLAGIVLRQSRAQVVGDANVEMLGIETLKDVDVFYGTSLKRLQRGAIQAIGLAEARLRPSGFDAAAFATMGLAEPKRA